MTDYHLLLYRLAELMFEHEQHMFSVDLLFDDTQIGDFAKSIQIDSPYQQMLLEGVLTETVRDEKLTVSFTVEGYFHYVLGEVIHKRTEGLGAEALKQIVEENKLNGSKEGVEQCLIRDVQKTDLTRLIWLIDEGGKALEICSYPLAQAFLIHSVEKIMELLLTETTDNDISVLEDTIQKLEELQKNEEVQTIYRMISKLILPNTFKKLSIIIDSSEYLEFENGLNLLNTLKKYINQFEDKNEQQLIYQKLGIQFFNKDDYLNSEFYLNKSIEIEKKINNKGKSNLIKGRLYAYHCLVWIARKQYEKALSHYKKELSVLNKSKENEEHNLAVVFNNIGYVYSELYDKSLKKNYFISAERNYEKSLTIRNNIFGKYHPSTAIVYNNLGLLYSGIGDFQRSEKYLSGSLDIRYRIFADAPPTDISYNNLSTLNFKNGDTKSAINFAEKALSIRLKAFGINNVKVATTFNNLAWYYYDLRDKDESLKFANNGLEIRKNIFGSNDLDVAESCILISTIYAEFNDYASAISYQLNALKIQLKKLEKNNFKIALSYSNLGSIFEKFGNIKKALFYYKKALKIELLIKGINNSETGLTFFAIANLYLEIKDYKKALGFFKKGFRSNKYSGGFPFRIVFCYENLNQQKKAIQFFCLSAELRKKSLGVNDDATKLSIQEALRLAQESNSADLLPKWIKNVTNNN
jgi:tetratricopeptide (TPR) repeat protein